MICSLALNASTDALTERLATGFLPSQKQGNYWAMASGYRASFDSEGVRLLRHGRSVSIRFPGSRLRWEGEGHLSAQLTFLGEQQRTVNGREALRAPSAFAGVDILIRLKDGRLKSEFQLAAGVKTDLAGYCLNGATIRASDDGQSLHIDAGDGWQWEEKGLESWQLTAGGVKVPVPSRFLVTGQCVRFDVADVDPSLPLIIDPELVFSSYLGGGMFDAITAVATDTSGSLYVGGWTESSDFPNLNSYQSAAGGRIDGFVAKIDAAGQLLFASYLGGLGEDRVQAIAVDSTGSIAVAGVTNSTNFPTHSSARGTLAGGRDAFVAGFTSAGNALTFSTYLGGLNHDAANTVAFDSAGNIVVGGETASTDFPTQAAISATHGGGIDGFLARFSPSGVLLSSTFLGGTSDDRIRSVTVGPNGVLHLTGSTASSNFPVSNALFPSLRGGMDAFYTRLNAGASAMILSSYLGGAGGSSLNEESGYGITIDTVGRTWIAGVTPSSDFPGVASGHQPMYGGGPSDAFVSVFTAAGSLEWSTYIGGTGLDAATSISASSGFVGLAGYTTSNNLPVTSALQTMRGGEYDVFWAAYPNASTAPLHISYLGGTGSDSALAASASGSTLVIGGSTLSNNFPLQSSLQSGNARSFGGFASRLRFGPSPLSIAPSTGRGLAATFTLRASHASGSAAISSAAFLFNASYSFVGGCYAYYQRATNLVYLYRDADSTWVSLAPGAASTISNGACMISGTGLTVTSVDSTLVVALPLTFSGSFAGVKQIYVDAIDSAGLGAGWPGVGSWDVAGQSTPAVTGVAPASGGEQSQSFSLTFSDANGHADMVSMSFLVNTSVSTSNGCYITYTRASNTFALFRDSDATFLPITPGTGAVVENSNCAVSGSGITVTGSGTQLVIGIPVTFKGAFTGNKTIYAAVTDAGGLTSGWQSIGAWSFSPAYAPLVTSLQPASGESLSQTFTFQYADGNGFADIASVLFAFNTALSTANGCYLSYTRSSNTMSLYRDADSSWVATTPGSTATIENTNCSINATAFEVSSSGNNLQVSIPVTFKPTLFGALKVYTIATDQAGLSSGWVPAGTWTAVGSPGQPASNGDPQFTTPAPGSTLAGSTVTFQWTVRSGATKYWLDVGTVAGSGNVCASGAISATSFTCSGIPGAATSSIIHAQVWAFVGGAWLAPTRATFTGFSAADPRITLPTPGSTLAGSTVTFQWTARFGATKYWLDIGTGAGLGNVCASGAIAVTTFTCSGIPGATFSSVIHSQVWAFVGSTWLAPTQATFTAPSVTDPQITSPAPGSTLAGSTVTFQWTARTGATNYWLDVGTVAGSGNVCASGAITATSFTCSGIPGVAVSSVIHAQVWALVGGSWLNPNPTHFTASSVTDPQITSPAPGATLTGSTVTFQWTARTGATNYWLDVGTVAGSGNVCASGAIAATSFTCSGIPGAAVGRVIHAQVWASVGGTWLSPNQASFTASSASDPQISSPPPGSKLTGSTVTFHWTPRSGATGYWVDVGTVATQGNVCASGKISTTSFTCSGIPRSTASTIYVQVWSFVGGAWVSPNQFTFAP